MYNNLMDGLECSVLNLKKIQNNDMRFDSEYYSKRNLYLSEKLNSIGTKTIGNYGGKLDCSAFYPSITEYYSNDRNNIPFLRVNEIKDGLIVITDHTVFLPSRIIEDNRKTIALAYPGDIIIAKGGNTLAKVGLVTNEYPMYATCRDVIILRTDELDTLNKYYLWAFLHSEYGQGILWRSASQTGQPHLTLPSIMRIKVPDSILLQNTMQLLYEDSVKLKDQAEKLYKESEMVLNRSFGLQHPNDTNIAVAVKELSNTFVKTGRFDAEYYQPKYDKYVEEVLSYRNGYTQIVSEFEPINTQCDRKKEEYPYVEIGDINVSDGVASYNTICTENLPANAKIMTKKGDIIVSTVRPNRGAVSILETDDLLVSGAFTVLREKGEYKKEVLQTLLRTDMYRDWLLQYNVGTSYPVIKDIDVLKMPIPVFEHDIQDLVADKIQESFSLRRKSKQLLEYAKRAVEIAIEQDEESAIEWLKERKKEAGV